MVILKIILGKACQMDMDERRGGSYMDSKTIKLESLFSIVTIIFYHRSQLDLIATNYLVIPFRYKITDLYRTVPTVNRNLLNTMIL